MLAALELGSETRSDANLQPERTLLAFPRTTRIAAPAARVTPEGALATGRRLSQLPAALARSRHFLVAIKSASGRYLAANEPFASLFGVSGEMLTGRKDEEFMDPGEAASIAARDSLAMSTGGSGAAREAFGREVADIDLERVPLLDRDGEARALLLIGYDLGASRREMPSRALGAATALGPRAIQAVGGALLSILQRSLVTSPGAGRTEGASDREQVGLSGLLHQLEEYLELERIRGGIDSFERARFDLDEALFEGARRALARTPADLVIEQAYGMPRFFLGDAAHVREVVALGLAHVSLCAPSASVKLVVGYELPSDGSRSRVRFDFERVAVSRKGARRAVEAFGGDELGLTLLQEIVFRLGGEVELSADGDLAVSLELEVQGGPEADACGHSADLVLVAERSVNARRSLRSELDLAGYHSVAVSSAAELLHQLRETFEAGQSVHRVYIDDGVTKTAAARAALLEAVTSVVGAERVVRIEASADGIELSETCLGAPTLARPISRHRLRRTLSDDATRAARFLAPSVLPMDGATGPWIDVPAAVSRFEGDDELWRSLLGQFRLRYRDLCSRIESELAGRPGTEISQLARRVGGVASNLGLVELSSALRMLGDRLDGTCPVPGAGEFDQLRDAHEATFRVIDGLLTEDSVRRARELTPVLVGRPLAQA
jgi:hypothetical protein